MFCKHCGTKVPDDSKFCFHCGGQIAEALGAQLEASFANDVMEIHEFIAKTKNDVFSVGANQLLVKKLKNCVNSKETGENLIADYQRAVGRSMIKDLKALSNNYDTIREYLSPFIANGIVHPDFPHDRINQQAKSLETARPVNVVVPNTTEINTKPTGNKGCLIAILAVVLFAVVGSLFTSPDESQEVVSNSSFDASVSEVEEYLKDNLKDPGSYDPIEWSEVHKSSGELGYQYYVRHKYRSKNSFGGYVIANQIFFLDGDGRVVNVEDFQ